VEWTENMYRIAKLKITANFGGEISRETITWEKKTANG
jgi:hypothetical protein